MALGICTNCSSPTSPNSKWFCEDHLRKKAIVSINDRKKYKINKRCTRCAAPLDIDADAGHVDCINCRERGQNMMFVIHPFEKEVR
jgi:predicted amidophosphoribosyltransferase